MRTIVMTGVTRGIGQRALRRIMASGTELALVLVARKASSLAWVRDEAPAGTKVHLVEADLGSMTSATAAAEEISHLVVDGTVPAISSLVLNAGIQHVDANSVSADGLKDTFAVNVVANHLFIARLAPHMERQGRIVITVSDTHFGDLPHNLGMVPGPHWLEPRLLAQPGSLPKPDSLCGPDRVLDEQARCDLPGA